MKRRKWPKSDFSLYSVKPITRQDADPSFLRVICIGGQALWC